MAEVKPNVDTNRKRLADIIPIEAPFTVYIEQTRFCNIKCFYCIHSTRDDESGAFKKLGYPLKHMEFADFLKVINDLAEFPKGSIKRIVFSGLGEPLTNPMLPEFVKMAVEKEIAGRVEIITNGLLLSNTTVDKLLDANITNINVSIQGISAQQYRNVCGKDVDFDKFIKNLEYLQMKKKNTQVYIKAIDAAFETQEEEDMFYKLFSPLADRIYVEHLVQMQQHHDKIKGTVDASKDFFGKECDPNRKVCGQSFYFLQVGCDLDTFPCPVPGLPKTLSMGNIKYNTILDIWNGRKRKEHLKTMLRLEKDTIPECTGCTCFNAINDESEYLDKDASRLLTLFED
ncbi:radical SAM/SPASM domain-containing protein [Desulfopila sp. IMCC35008]|uniref:radical SAM/SPASM domain-containing protein n=1 Tax=Desulfopila sp. IMCC35008 TaxID=2653858 RepID=UPI0013D4CAF9|nr:radical SAM/SPASM domain-containing protein [Desulfopila sp. IMCC35008]